MTNNALRATTREIRRERRAAFALVSRMLPAAYRGIAKGAGLGHPEKTADREVRAHALLNAEDFPARVTRFLAGQFAVRLIATRAEIERTAAGPNPMELFRARMVGQLVGIQTEDLDGFSLQVSDIHAKTLAAVEGELASYVFASLQEEAGARGEAFDEATFWLDIFRGIGDADWTGNVIRGFQYVFLDHADRWEACLRLLAGSHVLDLQPARFH